MGLVRRNLSRAGWLPKEIPDRDVRADGGTNRAGLVFWLAVPDAIASGSVGVGGAGDAGEDGDGGIDGSASPRKPRVAMLRRSSAVRSFEVACLEKAVSTWLAGMPEPLSWTLMDLVPPCSMATEILRGAGVDGVFYQFLDHGRGPFDDFAGGDLRGDVGW